MMWNDIPFCEDASPEMKAMEFDLQLAENKELAPLDPYSRKDEE